LLNYLVRLGWSHGDQEIFTLADMEQLFDIRDVNKSASAFNPDKLQWLNQQHMMRSPPRTLAVQLQWQLERLGVKAGDLEQLDGIAAAQRERAKTLREMAQASLFFFRDFERYDEKAARKNLTTEARVGLAAMRARLATLSPWNAAGVHAALEAVCSEAGVGLGKVAQPLRVAVSGGAVSPPIDQTVALLGREVALKRIDRALVFIEKTPAP
jgi:glutamyl-tRNA synthetase